MFRICTVTSRRSTRRRRYEAQDTRSLRVIIASDTMTHFQCALFVRFILPIAMYIAYMKEDEE